MPSEPEVRGTAYVHETAALRFAQQHELVPLAAFRSREYSISQTGGHAAALRCLGHGWLTWANCSSTFLVLTEKGRKELAKRTGAN